MRPLRTFPLCVLAAFMLSSTAAKPQAIAPTVRIVNAIDERNLVTLKGSTHPLANARNDRGAAPDELQLERMHLVFKRSSSQEASLRSLITSLHTPGTASYHKWLTPEAFGKQFGPADEDVVAVETWLTGHGFSVVKVNPGKQTLEFSGNAAQFRNAFHAQIHKYEVNGEAHYANANDPQIPAALAPVVGGFVSLNNFRVRSYAKPLGKAHYDPKTDTATPEWTTGSSTAGYNFVLAPGDFAVQYDLGPLYTASVNGSGQTIAIINESNINIAQVNNFRSLFGLPANPPQVIIDGNDPGVDGINNPDGPNYASFEAYLDVEWAGAVAPNATVDLVIGADTALENGLFLAAEHAVYGNVAPVMSLSFGQCESILGGAENSFLSSLWEQAAAQGITVMVSTGDNGSAGCDDDNSEEYATLGQAVNGFASTPYNVAVGGTDFYYSAFTGGLTAMEAQLGTYWSTTASNSTPAVSIKGVIPEQPWNDSQYGLTLSTLQEGATPSSTSIAAGSGGASNYWTTKPSWQTGFGDTARDIPDVSLYASNGANASYYPICAVDGDCQPVSSGGSVQISGVGGTSASSPSFAGIMALVNQKYGRQGQADFVLYPLEKQYPAAFHDVTNGTNSVPCSYSATSSLNTPDCIAVTSPVTITDQNGNTVLEGEIGTGTTVEYNAVTGYDMATGLGTVDAAVLVNDWNQVTFAGTTTTLTPSSTSITHGGSITVNGSVTASSGTPSGDVAVLTSSSEESQQGQQFFTLSGGSYSGTMSTLPGGTYNIWGQYGGDAANSLSTSTPVQITVNPENSGIAFNIFSPTGVYNSTSAPGSIAYGNQLLLSATVTPTADVAAEQTCILAQMGLGSGGCPSYGIPTGTVAFSDSGKALNTAVINVEGEAEFNAPFAVGAHSVTASYAGDNSYNASTASAIAFTVAKDTPTIFIGASNLTSSGPYVAGQATVFNILVENSTQASASSFAPVQVAAPTGTVSVTGFPSGVPTSGTLSAGVDPATGAVAGIATITAPANTPNGIYGITINYVPSSDPNYLSATANSTVQIESFAGTPTTTTATSSGSISPTSSIVVTGTVTGTGSTAPTGGILVYSSGNYLTEVGFSSTSSDVSHFSFVLNSQLLAQGANFVTLQYTGDNTYLPSAFTLNSGSSISNPLSDFSLIPQATIVPVNVSGGGAGSGTDAIYLSSANGFSGAVNLTCTAASGVTCQVSPTAPTLASGGSSTSTLTINAAAGTPSANYNVLVTGKDSTGNFVHTIGVEAVVGTPLTAVPSFALSANPASLTIAAGATTSNTSTVTVSPISSFNSTVNLACSVTNSTNQSVSGMCNLAAASVASAAGTDLLTITTTSATPNGAYLVTVTGTSGSITQTTTVSVTVGTATGATFTLSASAPSPGTVAPGGTTTSNVSLTTSNGYSGTVLLSCAQTSGPSNASGDAPLCDTTNSAVAVGSTTPATVLTIAQVSGELQWPRIGGKGRGWTGAGGGALLALLAFLGIPARRRSWRSMLGMLIAMAALGSLAACGGHVSGGSTNPGNPGTTAGTYVFTVTGAGTPTVTPAPTTTFTVVVN